LQFESDSGVSHSAGVCFAVFAGDGAGSALPAPGISSSRISQCYAAAMRKARIDLETLCGIGDVSVMASITSNYRRATSAREDRVAAITASLS
jgi:hypothetical protein